MKTEKYVEINLAVRVPEWVARSVAQLIAPYVPEKTKADKPVSAKPTKPATTSKKSDDFPYDLYISTAEKLGCKGKHGVWQCCRATVYEVIGWDPKESKACKPTKTLAQGKKAVADIKKDKGWS